MGASPSAIQSHVNMSRAGLDLITHQITFTNTKVGPLTRNFPALHRPPNPIPLLLPLLPPPAIPGGPAAPTSPSRDSLSRNSPTPLPRDESLLPPLDDELPGGGPGHSESGSSGAKRFWRGLAAAGAQYRPCWWSLAPETWTTGACGGKVCARLAGCCLDSAAFWSVVWPLLGGGPWSSGCVLRGGRVILGGCVAAVAAGEVWEPCRPRWGCVAGGGGGGGPGSVLLRRLCV